MHNTISLRNQTHTLKPIKQIRLRTFKQIYQKQTSNPHIDTNLQPRKSFLNVTRRYSTISCPYSILQQQPQQIKSIFLKKKQQIINPQNNYSTLPTKPNYSTLQTKQNQTTRQKKQDWTITYTKGKQNITVNRIPIKIRSKRVNSKHQNMRKQKSFQEPFTFKCSKKLLQSPFNDDFICIEREFAIDQHDEENQEDYN